MLPVPDTSDKIARDMLIAIRAEKRSALDRVRELEEREKTIEGWLKGVEPKQGELKIIPRRVALVLPLSHILKNVLREGRPHSNQELADIAREKGAVFKDSRSINSVLLGFMRAGLVDRKDEKWIWRKVS